MPDLFRSSNECVIAAILVEEAYAYSRPIVFARLGPLTLDRFSSMPYTSPVAIATKTSILIVEDDPHFRESLIDAMAIKGVEARGASSGAEALRTLESVTPSLIVMDVQLPDQHGFELCRRIKRNARFQTVPVVFLSARFTEPGDRAEGLLAGAEAYLCKPVSMDALWDEIHYLLDKEG